MRIPLPAILLAAVSALPIVTWAAFKPIRVLAPQLAGVQSPATLAYHVGTFGIVIGPRGSQPLETWRVQFESWLSALQSQELWATARALR